MDNLNDMVESGERNFNPTASNEFMQAEKGNAEERCRQFLNCREIMLDVLFHLEKDGRFPYAPRMKRRVLNARTMIELRLVMDGLLAIGMIEDGKIGSIS